MGWYRRGLLAGMIAIALPGAVTPARANFIPMRQSYTQLDPGGRFVFVMLVPEVELDGAPNRDAIRSQYARSGLYPVDGPAIPLWTVDWYAARGLVTVSSDGVHLVRIAGGSVSTERWGQHADAVAVEFFANGRSVRSYTIRDLQVDPDRAERSVSGTLTRTLGYWVDDSSGRCEVSAGDGGWYVFDIKTGEMIAGQRAPEARRVPVVWRLAAAGGLAIACGIVLRLFWKRVSKAPPALASTHTPVGMPDASPAEPRTAADGGA